MYKKINGLDKNLGKNSDVNTKTQNKVTFILEKIKHLQIKEKSLYSKKLAIINNNFSNTNNELELSIIKSKISLIRIQINEYYVKLGRLYKINSRRRSLLEFESNHYGKRLNGKYKIAFNKKYHSYLMITLKSLLFYDDSIYYLQPIGIILNYDEHSLKYTICRNKPGMRYSNCKNDIGNPGSPKVQKNYFGENFNC